MPSDPIYYMREDHSFRRLSGDIDAMLVMVREDFDAGHQHGMLCSKAPGFQEVHGRGDWSDFEARARASLEKHFLNKEPSNAQ